MPCCFRRRGAMATEEHLATVNTVLNHVVTTNAAYIMYFEEFVPRIQHRCWWARAAMSCRRLANMIMEQKPVERVDGDDAGNEVVSRPRSVALTTLASLHEKLKSDLQQSLARDVELYEVWEQDSDGNLFSPSPFSDRNW